MRLRRSSPGDRRHALRVRSLLQSGAPIRPVSCDRRFACTRRDLMRDGRLARSATRARWQRRRVPATATPLSRAPRAAAARSGRGAGQRREQRPRPTNPALTSTGSDFVIVVVGRPREHVLELARRSRPGSTCRRWRRPRRGACPRRCRARNPPPPPPPNPPKPAEPARARRLVADELLAAGRARARRRPPSRSRSCTRARRGRPPAARRRAASGPALFAPSVSSTTMSGTYAPLRPAAGSTPGSTRGSRIAPRSGRPRRWRRSTARIPLPIAVRRPVVRLLIASTRACWSVVGGWITAASPLNATSPISEPALWLVTNSIAASSAASMRVGSMSVEHMLPDTSIARMIVAELAGTLSTIDGPAERDHQRRDRPRRTARTAGGAAAARRRAAPPGSATGSSSARRRRRRRWLHR